MKHLLLLACIALIVVGVSATSLNFQNPGDTTDITVGSTAGSATGRGISWVESTTAGNSYVDVYWTVTGVPSVGAGVYMVPLVPSSSTYAAATYVGAVGVSPHLAIALFDSGGTQIGSGVCSDTSPTANHRYEVKVSGTTAYCYDNGAQFDTITGVSANPQLIGFGETNPYTTGTRRLYYDDFVFGQGENPRVAGLPESDSGDNQIILYKDITNSALHGTAFSANFSVINSDTLYANWARGNVSDVPPTTLANETIQFVNYGTGKVIATNYTGTAYVGSIAIDVKSVLFDAGEPQGFYAIYWPGYGYYSNIMEYRSNGATVNWASKSYSVGDTGAVIYFVLDGGYWSTAYSYKMAITNIYGEFKQNTTITTQTGTVTQTWTEGAYTPDVYWAWLIATKSDGTEYILGGDYTTLYDYAKLYGWVMEDKTGNPVIANINCTYDSSWENVTSEASGNYTTAAVFLSGTTPGCNVSATGYQTYWWNASLLSGSSKLVNFTLQSDTHPNTGTALGGVDRDTLYKNPIPSKVIQVVNTSNSESHLTTTNIAGWWMVDSLTAGRYYCATGFKTGYTNTTSCMTVV